MLHSEAGLELPPFSSFQSMLELFGFTGDFLAFFLQVYPERYLPDLIDIWYDIIPEEIWNKPEAIPDYAPDSEYQGDLYTAELLRAMRKTGIFNEDLILDGLTARHPKVRFAAAECIEQYTERSESINASVEKALNSEPDPSVRRMLRHLTGSNDPDLPMLPFPPSPVAVSKQDSVLFRTTLTRIEGIGPEDGAPIPVPEDEPLCIVQHPVQQKMLIARKDGTILGGLPEDDEKFLSLARESGRSFYAKLETQAGPDSRQDLLICESLPDLPVRKPDNVLPFRRR